MAKVTIYTAPKCPHSENLKNFLNESGIAYEDRCVLTNPDIYAEVFEKTQQRGIPVTIIGSDVYVGFDRRTERRMRRAMGE